VSLQDKILEEIRKLDISIMSPLDALNKLDELKKKLEREET